VRKLPYLRKCSFIYRTVCANSIVSCFFRSFYVIYNTFSCIASLAYASVLVLYSCGRTIHSSLIVCMYEGATVQRSFFVSTIWCNTFVCVLFIAVAASLRGHAPTIMFSFKMHTLLALLSLALAYPLWSRVSELKIDALTLTELPIVQSGTLISIVRRFRSLAKQTCSIPSVISF
jgi:hypothetical protein